MSLNRFFLLVLVTVVSSQLSYYPTTAPSNNTCRIISVSGSGVSNGIPDTAIIILGVSARGNTSIVALGQMNAKAQQLLTILKKYSIPTGNTQTSSLTLGPDYSYQNGSQKLNGQKASQTFTVRVNQIGNGSIIGSIVDAATNIQNITVSGLTFDINNKTTLLGTANRKAWDDAYDKASQLASLSNARLGRANKINVLGQPRIFSVRLGQMLGAAAQGAPTQISVGNYVVTANINVDFLIA